MRSLHNLSLAALAAVASLLAVNPERKRSRHFWKASGATQAKRERCVSSSDPSMREASPRSP